MATVEKIMTAPMDRSMPAVRMMRVWAIASVPTMETCWKISDRLPSRRKRSLVSPKTRIAATRTMAGLIAGFW